MKDLTLTHGNKYSISIFVDTNQYNQQDLHEMIAIPQIPC